MKQVFHRAGLAGGGVAQFAQARFQRFENAFKHGFVVGGDVAAEGAHRIAHLGNVEIAALCQPSGKQVIVADEVAEVFLDKLNQFALFSQLTWEIGFFQALRDDEFFQFVGEEFVKDKAENIVFVFVGFDFGAHFVGGLPDFGGELLFVHVETPKRVDLMEKRGILSALRMRCRRKKAA